MSQTNHPVEAGQIDLNEAWPATAPRHDLAEIRHRLADRAKEWMPALFPNARRMPDGRTMRCADLSGRAPRGEGSCVLHLEGRFAGWGFDHATGESAGPIDMVHHGTGLSDANLFTEAARLAHMEQPAPAPRARETRPDHSHEVARLLEGCQPLAGSLAENSRAPIPRQ